ncbi:MAG: alpha/beta hydrolase [Steroidobacter sp.]
MALTMASITMAGIAGAGVVDTFKPTSAEKDRLELMSKPEKWFLKNLAGPREVVDGQTLDPKLQYYLEGRRRRTPDEVKRGLDMFLNAEGRATARNALSREWALMTKVTAPMRSTEQRAIPGPAGSVPIRIYTPETDQDGPLPVLLYFHGGGWIYSGIDAVDRAVRLIANEAQVIVISVDYRLAPEHPWPAANDDGEAAFLWARANAASFGGDPEKIAVGGDSAGGNISMAISNRQVLTGKPTPLYQLLYYTAIDFSPRYESSKLFAQGYSLDATFRDFMMSVVYPDKATAERAVKELRSAKMEKMPATIIVTAGFDMLRDPGQSLARRMEKAGTAVTYLNYPTLMHGFLQWSGVVADVERAAVESARLFGNAVRTRRAVLRSDPFK